MKTDVSEKGLEDIIVDHLVTVNGYELGRFAQGLDGVLQAVQGERRLPRLALRPHVRACEGNRRGIDHRV